MVLWRYADGMRLFGVTVAVVIAGCGGASLEHGATLDFGPVPFGESRTSSLQVTNRGAATTVTLALDGADFSLDATELSLAQGETVKVRVHFAPSEIGPRRATLTLRANERMSTVSLSGVGAGARLSVDTEVIFDPVPLIDSEQLRAPTLLRAVSNVGTAGSVLHFEVPPSTSGEVCIGSFNILGGCMPWMPPGSLAAGETTMMPISIRPLTAGVRSWSFTILSDDPVTRAQAVTVRALVEQLEPCRLSGTTSIELDQGPAPVTVTHLGQGTCLVNSVQLRSSPEAQFVIVEPVTRLPARLASNMSMTVWVDAVSGTPRSAKGTMHVIPLSGPELVVDIAFKSQLANCLAVSPSVLDFGTVKQGCNSSNRSLQLFNSCAVPLTIDSVVVSAGAGQAPGSRDCPGVSACPEFILVSGAAGTLPPGSSAFVVVRYRPLDVGADTGALSVDVRDVGETPISLAGRGDVGGVQVDSFRDEPLPVVDVLAMVDTSPSFAAKRAGVRANFEAWLGSNFLRCVDLRWAFAPADGAPDAGVTFALNDAGSAWTSSLEPDFVARALSAFDALPAGSETEACIGPAAALMQNVAPRDGGSFAGLCVTDALEQSASPMVSLQQLRARSPSTTWSAVTGLASSSCSIEAADDGVHAALVQASNGAREDVCTPSWWNAFTPLGFPTCGARSQYYLTSRPAPGTLEMWVGGSLVPASDWSWDATNNAVSFVAGHVPPPGSTIEARYSPVCVP